MCGYVNKSIKAGLRKRHQNEARDRANAGGTHMVFKIGSNGKPNKTPHEIRSQSVFTEAEANAEITRMMELNPGKRWVAIKV